MDDPDTSALIIDTDIGGDADDALAVAIAARSVPQLALLISTDETAAETVVGTTGARGPGQRARFARHLLDELGRTDVPVVAGAGLGGTLYYCVEGLVPRAVPDQKTDVVAAVREVAAAHSGPIRWVGMGPLTNLAALVGQAPELLPRLRVTQMGGALRYRNPDRAEHNFRLDATAVHTVFTAVADSRLAPPEFVTSEITFVPETDVSAEHPVYRSLAASGAPAWATLLVDHMDRWFTRFHPASKQHDALALSIALGLPFVESEDVLLALDAIARTTRTDHGTPVRVSTSADYAAFMSWVAARLDPKTEPLSQRGAGPGSGAAGR